MRFIIFWHSPDDYEILPVDSARAKELYGNGVPDSFPMALDEAKAMIRSVLNTKITRLRAEISQIGNLSPDSFTEEM